MGSEDAIVPAVGGAMSAIACSQKLAIHLSWRRVQLAMDSKRVGRELWKVVRPLLREGGWTSFSGRTARRFSQSRIDVVSFQSFNSYLASRIGSTTYSFAIRLGCFFTAIPHSGIKIKDGLLMPEEYHCHLRYTIPKKFYQSECDRTDIFYVDPNGDYLPAVIEAARQGIGTEGFAWFRRFSDMQEVLRTLMEDNESNNGTFGFGARASPTRNLYTGYIALFLGRNQIAAERLSQAAVSPSYAHLREQIEAQLSSLK